MPSLALGDGRPIARSKSRTAAARELSAELTRHIARDRLLTYAAAIAFQALVALVPLALLGLGLLGALGLEDTWTKSIAPAIEKRVTEPVFRGIDHTVERALNRGSAGLIALAVALSLWYLSSAVRTMMEALNQIHGTDDGRSWSRRRLTSAGLAAASGICLVGSYLVLVVAPRVAGDGFGEVLLGVGRWAVAVVLLALAVALLVRYGPADHPEPRWASAGSVLIIGAWIVASLLFGLYASTLADFRSPLRSLTALLVLNGYLFTTAMIFLVGVELDELVRRRSRRRS